MSTRNRYSGEFKSKLVLELLKEQKTLTQLATENGINPCLLVKWRNEVIAGLPMMFENPDSSRVAKENAKQDKLVEDLYSQVGKLTTQLNWLKKKLATSLTKTERRALVDWDRPSVSIKVQAELLSLNRTGLYYRPVGPSDEEVEIKRAIDQLHYDHPSWGSRKIAALLKSQEYRVNRKRIQRYMREMAITVVYPGPNLSKRNQQHHVYPYLLRDLSIDHVGQVYSTDITYIPLKRGWMYLTAVMDWYSRYIVSWELSDSLHTDFVIRAVDRALAVKSPEIMNSDQGCQYTCHAYTDMLKGRGVRISMDGRGRALDNVVIERFWRTLKRDEVYMNEYATPREAREAIAGYIEAVQHLSAAPVTRQSDAS